ncbi:hypothetical protein ABFS83_01G105500 [Erythranthe nasuta]
MGRLFVKELRETPHIVCINCRTCIAVLRHKLHLPPDEAEENVGVFRKVVNVQVEEYQNYQVGPHTVTNIYCIKCGNELGCQYIHVVGEQNILRDGYVKIMMEQTLEIRDEEEP